ncbi:hypothetical protein U1Q18_018281 [Sarracenia purpurea var. burkii]
MSIGSPPSFRSDELTSPSRVDSEVLQAMELSINSTCTFMLTNWRSNWSIVFNIFYKLLEASDDLSDFTIADMDLLIVIILACMLSLATTTSRRDA